MRLFHRSLIEAVQINSMETAMETWRKKQGGIDLMESTNGSGDGGDEDQAKPGKENVGIEVCADADWVAGLVMVSVGCLSDADAIEGVVGILLYRSDTGELNENKLFGDIVWVDGEMYCEAEKGGRFWRPNERARS